MISSTTDADALRPYLGDESSAFSGHAECAYFPTNAAEVAEILTNATSSRTPVTVSGGGTSITGARVPTRGGWIIAMDRMVVPQPPAATSASAERDWTRVPAGDGAIYLDAARMRAVVPTGIRLSDLDAALAPHGLFYPPTLTETSAMIGGTIATNASGARSYHYGATRAWVEAVQVVTGAGHLLHLRRGAFRASCGQLPLDSGGRSVRLPNLPQAHALAEMKNAAGYFLHPEMDAVDLFVGGEGTLGVVTEAELRLQRREDQAIILVVFASDRDRALDYADAVRGGLFRLWNVLAIEFFDRNSLEFMRDAYPEIPHAEAAVLVEVAPPNHDGTWRDGAELAGRWRSLLEPYDAVEIWTVLPTEREQARLFRHSLPDRVNDYVRTRRGKLGTDLAVPADRFRSLVSAYDAAGAGGVRTVLFGHLGEFHLHLNFLGDDAAQMERAVAIYAELARTAVGLGGTVSAEHGVGKKQIRTPDGRNVPYLELMYGVDGLHALADLKRQLDPAWVLNPDTLIPYPGSEQERA